MMKAGCSLDFGSMYVSISLSKICLSFRPVESIFNYYLSFGLRVSI